MQTTSQSTRHKSFILQEQKWKLCNEGATDKMQLVPPNHWMISLVRQDNRECHDFRHAFIYLGVGRAVLLKLNAAQRGIIGKCSALP